MPMDGIPMCMNHNLNITQKSRSFWTLQKLTQIARTPPRTKQNSVGNPGDFGELGGPPLKTLPTWKSNAMFITQEPASQMLFLWWRNNWTSSSIVPFLFYIKVWNISKPVQKNTFDNPSAIVLRAISYRNHQAKPNTENPYPKPKPNPNNSSYSLPRYSQREVQRWCSRCMAFYGPMVVENFMILLIAKQLMSQNVQSEN